MRAAGAPPRRTIGDPVAPADEPRLQPLTRHLRARGREVGARYLEPSVEAEEAWVRTVHETAADTRAFQAECTPGYYNNEGKDSEREKRNATFGYGSPAFIKILNDWREEDGMKGVDVTYAKDEAADALARSRI